MFLNKSWIYKSLIMILIIMSCLISQEKLFAQVLSLSVNKEHILSESGIIIDQKTGKPIPDAKVSIPSKGIETVTDELGIFQLEMPKERPLILSVKADGYKPFSLIIEKTTDNNPFKIGLLEKTGNEIVIDTRLHHLGDNKFSKRSANASDFTTTAIGNVYFQDFYIDNLHFQENIVLKIGSIIGIDTRTAQSLRQSEVSTSASSPVEVFFNSHKIGEIDFNGNNHIIKIPSTLVQANLNNNIKIKTGINLSSSSRRKDYDDIEFIHLILEF
ncbi:MAG TPA: carboxypeptidase-like regulatory domain-containing protein [Candidatus Gastranaerophilales bacterium]|nr:carboxypeptidase-like regulatory domain-containing protein [Candidatus Gastranaerophilales bacterium]